MINLNEHPLRKALAAEIRARPYGMLQAPARISYLAALSSEHGFDDDHAHVLALCKTFNANPPAIGANHFTADLGLFLLKWERHTEFATYSFYGKGAFDDPFADPVVNKAPKDWLKAIPGQIIAAAHVALETKDAPERTIDDLAAFLGGDVITGSRMFDGKAKVWCDFKVNEDGFGRILIRDEGLTERAAGRLIQRLLEIEAYRMIAMLAFPMAREARPKIAAVERRLSEIVFSMTQAGCISEERLLLEKLSGAATEIEAISAAVNFRFGATSAYYDLIKRRVEELREERIEGLQPPGEFLYRRLAPAMETCESVAARQVSLSRRIAHSNDLLRTRVNVALEEQNQVLLMSMDKRARLQLRLQETVEGLSVVAISYYLLGMVNHLAHGAKAILMASGNSYAVFKMGAAINPEAAVAVAFPFVVGVVWLGLRRLRKSIKNPEKKQQ